MASLRSARRARLPRDRRRAGVRFGQCTSRTLHRLSRTHHRRRRPPAVPRNRGPRREFRAVARTRRPLPRRSRARLDGGANRGYARLNDGFTGLRRVTVSSLMGSRPSRDPCDRPSTADTATDQLSHRARLPTEDNRKQDINWRLLIFSSVTGQPLNNLKLSSLAKIPFSEGIGTEHEKCSTSKQPHETCLQAQTLKIRNSSPKMQA